MRLVRQVSRLLVAVTLVVMAIGQVLGQPVVVSFVETGSMAPTLSPGDGFVAVPSIVASPVEPGDVVTYRAETVGGGGLTTHRVVGTTGSGFVTRGDANTFTDQSAGEPPVTEARIVAVALQVDGEVVALPGVGSVTTAIRGGLNSVAAPVAETTGVSRPLARAGMIFLVAVIASLVAEEGKAGRERSVTRDTGLDPRWVTLIVTGTVVLSATAAMTLPTGPSSYEVVSAEADAPGPRVIPAGEAETAPYVAGNGGFIPIVVFLAGDDRAQVDENRFVVSPRENVTTNVTLSAPPEIGLYRFTVTERRYLAVLPVGMITALHAVHPLVPLVVINILLGAVTFAVTTLLVGRTQGKGRNRNGPGTLKRWLP